MRERIPYLLLTVRQLSSEPSPRTASPGSPPSVANHPPKRRASRRAVRRARLDPNLSPKRYPPNRTDTSEPSGSTPGPSRPNDPPKRYERAVGSTPGPSRSAPSAEAPRASRWAVRRARLDRTIRRKQHTGNTPGPSRIEPSAEAPRACRRAICPARLDPNHPPKRHERAVEQAVAAEPRAIRRSSRSQRAPQISNRTP